MKLSGSQRGFLSIAGGSAGGQLLATIAVPILSRVYTPSDFGILAVVTAMGVTVGTVACARLDLTIPLPALDRDAVGLVKLALWASVLAGALGLLTVAVWGSAIADALNQEAFRSWLWAVPVVGAAMGFSLALNQWAVRQQRFTAVGRRTLLQNVTMLVTQLVGGFLRIGPVGLVGGLVVGYLSSAASLLFGSGLGSDAYRRQGRSELRALLRRYWRFPVLLGPAGLLNVLSLQLPVLLVSAWFGGQVAGWLGMTQRVLALPVTLIGAAIAQVFLGHIARAVRSDLALARRMFIRVSRLLCVASATFAVVLLAAGPWLFTVVLGSAWTESGEYARALSLGVAAQFVASPLSQTLIALERVVWQFWLDVGRLTTIVGSMWLVVAAGGSPLDAMWALSAANVVTYTAMWLLSRRALDMALSLDTAPPHGRPVSGDAA